MSSPVQDLSVLHQRREQRLMLALALPALLVILLLVVLPVGWLAWQSVYHNGLCVIGSAGVCHAIQGGTCPYIRAASGSSTAMLQLA